MGYITELDKRYIANTYARFPVQAVGFNHNRYPWQCIYRSGTGISVSTFGIADDAWQDAVIAQ